METQKASPTVCIRRAILAQNAVLRKKYRWLRFQSAIGIGLLFLFLALFILCGWLYLSGTIAWWVCLLLNTFFISIVHEIEHDLLHDLYFRNNRVMHHLMLALGWLVRPCSPNPWVRRALHLRHHRLSGTPEDLEERALTNGFRWGVWRIVMTADLMLASLKVIGDLTDRPEKLQAVWLGIKSYFPVTVLAWAAWYAFLLFHFLNFIFQQAGVLPLWLPGASGVMTYLDALVVILIAPNVLWTFCLHFISSNIHYYGDIGAGALIRQTQVMNSPWLWPFNLFCANFGSTHGIHHFVVNEPFYLRQMSAKAAHRAMRGAGVRFNDFGTFRRANRWGKDAE